jgi:hypothetical protein
MSQVAELPDPKLQKIAERIALEAELAVEKVAVSFTQPTEYPLTSDAKSIERILESRFNILPQATKQAAAARAINRINAPAAERAARYGDLAGVDLTNSVAIDTQVQALLFPEDLKLPPDHPIIIFNLRRQERVPAVLLRQQATNKLELRIHRVKCLDETDGFLGSEAGDDEIYLGGTNVDESGDAEKIDPFLVRDDFDDGEEQTYLPPKQFTSFDLTEGTDFPKSYFVTLVLAEVDNGGLPEVLHKLLMWVKEKVTTALTTAIGGAIGASGGPIGAAIGAAVGAAVGLIIDFIKEIWEDDAFEPATLRVDIPSLDARWPGDMTDSPEGVITYRGHGGEYQVTYDWRIFGPPVPELPRVAQGIIYAIELTGLDPVTGRRTGDLLLWYRHDGRGDGSFRWAQGSGNKVGNGWNNFKQVFSGGDGVIYAIQHTDLDPRTGRITGGHLLWYRHDGRGDGSFTWAQGSGNRVGSGWNNFKHVFSGDDGVIYAIQDNGDLLWYRHDGRGDGTFTWAPGPGNRVGNGWNFWHVFSGGDGVIYAIEHVGLDPVTGRRTGGRLLWFRHDGRGDGTFTWAPGSGNQVGSGWGGFKQVFSGGDGVIYAIQDNGDLLWYRHDGRGDGSFTWAEGSGTKVGNGWNFWHVFSG